ncbi:MAG: S1/P1 nuclease [Planctomycetia bacterium]|nr:S1/P1 nuclease [Planctomycetia bacterium]
MRRLLVPLLFFGLLTVPAQRAEAWNELGHMAIAKVAYDQADDGLKLRVFNLLKAHPHFDEYLAKSCPEGIGVQEWAWLRASIWPDWIRHRREKETRGERVYKFSRPDDHYINVPFIDPARLDLFKDLKSEPDKHDILAAFRQRVGEINLREASAEDKAIALCWLFHLVGDVHQPLHCCTFYSAQFPEGDRGGTRFAFASGGKRHQLHRFWDEALGDVPGSDDDPAPRQGKLYKRIAEVAESLRQPDYGREQLRELRDNPTFPAWVRESHGWAVKTAYRNGTLQGVPTKPDGSLPANAPAAANDYETAARALARQRAALAGHRLADKLKELKLAKD